MSLLVKILALPFAPLALLPDSLFDSPVEGAMLATATEGDAWAITEGWSPCQSCGSPVDPGAKRCRKGCRV